MEHWCHLLRDVDWQADILRRSEDQRRVDSKGYWQWYLLPSVHFSGKKLSLQMSWTIKTKLLMKGGCKIVERFAYSWLEHALDLGRLLRPRVLETATHTARSSQSSALQFAACWVICYSSGTHSSRSATTTSSTTSATCFASCWSPSLSSSAATKRSVGWQYYMDATYIILLSTRSRDCALHLPRQTVSIC